MTRAHEPEKLRWARLLTAVGGALILAGSLFFLLFATLIFGVGVGFLPTGGDIIATGVFALVAAYIFFGLVLGAVALYGAFQYERENAQAWAIAVMVCGGIAFVTGAGFLVGAILALAGGALAFSGLPPRHD